LEPTPCDTEPLLFASFGLDGRLLEGIRDLGFVETRPIQTAVIRLAIQGSDLIACAETGTGKTVAFVVPTLQRLLTRPAGLEGKDAEDNLKIRALPDEVMSGCRAARSRVLVLAPTRELAVKI
jgi:superfamily II DNA/RNA helicase